MYEDRPASEFPALAQDMAEWAAYPGLGNLPVPSARAFGDWLEDSWSGFAADADLTTGQALKLALEQWIGGRSI